MKYPVPDPLKVGEISISKAHELADYVIFEKNGTYYVEAGDTFAVDASFSDGAKAVQYAYDNISNGKIGLATSITKWDSVVTIPTGQVTLEGLNHAASKLKATSSVTEMIRLDTDKAHLKFSNLQFDPNGGMADTCLALLNQSGGAWNHRIDDCEFRGGANNYALEMDYSDGVKITNSLISDPVRVFVPNGSTVFSSCNMGGAEFELRGQSISFEGCEVGTPIEITPGELINLSISGGQINSPSTGTDNIIASSNLRTLRIDGTQIGNQNDGGNVLAGGSWNKGATIRNCAFVFGTGNTVTLAGGDTAQAYPPVVRLEDSYLVSGTMNFVPATPGMIAHVENWNNSYGLENSGRITDFDISSTGTKNRSITFTPQYPSGFTPHVVLEPFNPSANDWEGWLAVAAIDNTGCSVRLHVSSASATAGEVLRVDWRALPW